MKISKCISASAAAVLATCVLTIGASAETSSVAVNMQDTGYGINGGVSFSADGINMYESTLGDLAELYDSIDFSITADDLGGRNDLLFQVYVSADNWGIWANGNETPAISEAGTEYSFSLDVDAIADNYGSDKIICDMGFQILSQTAGEVPLTYTVNFYSENSADTTAENNKSIDDYAAEKETTSPQTGNIGISGIILTSALTGTIAVAAGKRKHK